LNLVFISLGAEVIFQYFDMSLSLLKLIELSPIKYIHSLGGLTLLSISYLSIFLDWKMLGILIQNHSILRGLSRL
jgi:hypothetical protein